MLVSLKILLRCLILPPAGPLLLAFLGTWLVMRRGAGRARALGAALLLGALAALWLLSLPLLADALWHAAERVPLLDPARAHEAQAIVILGGGTERRAAPEYAGAAAAGPDLLVRLAYGAYLQRRTGLPILVTGSPAEGVAMRASLERDFGVPVRWVEDQSRDTFENAQFSAAILRGAGVTGVLLVTHSVHAYRAMREFEACGLHVVPAPVGLWQPPEPHPFRYVPQIGALKRSTDALYELIGEPVRRVLALLHLRRHPS